MKIEINDLGTLSALLNATQNKPNANNYSRPRRRGSGRGRQEDFSVEEYMRLKKAWNEIKQLEKDEKDLEKAREKKDDKPETKLGLTKIQQSIMLTILSLPVGLGYFAAMAWLATMVMNIPILK